MVITKDCIHRLAYDVKYINNNPLDKNNIFYKHDDDNILKGYAMIIGNKDTPYYNGIYFFEFNFPENYPYEPIKVNFITNDGKMRFNPNLYVNGKVCLSVLNTWSGEGWTSCQNISSILIILSTIFNEEPLINEPGINKNNVNVKKYNLLVEYKNIEFSILKQYNILEKLIENPDINNLFYNFTYFIPKIKDHFIKNKKNIINSIDNLDKLIEKNNKINVCTYNLEYLLDIDNLRKNTINFFNKIN